MSNEITYPIKVLIMDTVMDRGGAETMTMNYMRNIDRSKIQFDFLVHRDYKAAYEDEINELGGKIYRICPIYPQNFIKYTREIKKFFDEHPEYMIVHCNMMELGYFAYKEAAKHNVPVIICHSHSTHTSDRMSSKYLVRLYFRARIKPYITHRFSCGEDAGKWLYGNNSEFTIMHNAIDPDLYVYNAQTDKEVREKFNIKDEFVIGHVGRFFPPKNHPFIIDIFYEIHKKDSNAILMLVGGGETDNRLLNETKAKVRSLGLEEYVIFTGVREDVNRLMQAFDVFILPSLHEGLPVTMIEAQAAGLKCVISDAVPDECDITHNVEKISLNKSPEYWADRILSYKGTYKKKNMSQQIAINGYDIKANAKWLEEYYINALRGTK